MKRIASIAGAAARRARAAPPPHRPDGEGRGRHPRLPEGVGRLREPVQHRLRHHEQPHDAVGRGLRQDVPQREDPGRGQGLLDRAARAHRRHRAVRPHVAGDARDRDRPVREEVRVQADAAAHLVRRPRRLREQGQPAREGDPGPDRRRVLQDPPPGRQERGEVGRPRSDRRLGGPAAQPVRPQLRQRHLRLLQGERPRQRRLQGHGEGAAGLGVGGAGRHRGPLRHRVQRHRVQDLRA